MDKNDFDKALEALSGNSSLKTTTKKNNNIQKSMMIDKDIIKAHRVNDDGTFSAYVNQLALNDMKNKGWL